MLEFITKADYFNWMERLPVPRRGQMKDAQDGFILSIVQGIKGQRVLEMGGGDSRLLRRLAAENECWNADRFQGRDGGPPKEVVIPGVRNAITFVGEFSEQLPSHYFDTVFSISVIEHLSDDAVILAFKDIARMLKPGGVTAHAIDMYLVTGAHAHQEMVNRRMRLYASIAEETGLRLREPQKASATPRFDSAHATNSDLGMFHWNSVAPNLKTLREVAQACSLRCIWDKPK